MKTGTRWFSASACCGDVVLLQPCITIAYFLNNLPMDKCGFAKSKFRKSAWKSVKPDGFLFGFMLN